MQFYIWNDVEARRGSSEIASCLYHYIDTILGKNVPKLVIFNNNFSDQNKNIYFICFA